MDRARANVQVLLKMVGLSIFYDTFAVITFGGLSMSGSPRRAQRINTPFTKEQQAWVRVMLKFGSLKKKHFEVKACVSATFWTCPAASSQL